MIRSAAVAVLMALALSACGGSSATSSTVVAAVQVTTAAAALRPGQTSQFSATAVNAYGYAINGAGAVSWLSDAPTIASVDASGLVTAVGAGSTSIRASIQGITGTRVVTVVPTGTGAIVTMPGNSFIPFEVAIRVGEAVYFEFPQVVHNVIFARVSGAPPDIPETKNATIARTFNAEGRFLYDCTLHPGMTGAVQVNP